MVDLECACVCFKERLEIEAFSIPTDACKGEVLITSQMNLSLCVRILTITRVVA